MVGNDNLNIIELHRALILDPIHTLHPVLPPLHIHPRKNHRTILVTLAVYHSASISLRSPLVPNKFHAFSYAILGVWVTAANTTNGRAGEFITLWKVSCMSSVVVGSRLRVIQVFSSSSLLSL